MSTAITKDADICELIACPKIFRTPPKKPTTINKNISQTFDVYGKDTDLRFAVFITYSQRFPQDFSIGLMHDSFLLLRCNGFHGTTKAGFYTAEHHAYPHAHLLTIDDIQNGRSKKPSHIEDLTGKYMNIDSAKKYFFNRCTILDYANYFDLAQYTLFD